VALAAAASRLANIGLDRIAEHEQALTAYAMARLARVPGLTIHGPTGEDAPQRKVGVVPFTLDGWASGHVAAVLGYEHGIGVRAGCFCAQPYVAHLLSLRPADVLGAAATGGIDGMVRISLGGYSDTGDVDRVVDALEQISAGAVRSPYRREPDGSWVPGPSGR
jgi:selenocysteine lyase/cysteine desulfurase